MEWRRRLGEEGCAACVEGCMHLRNPAMRGLAQWIAATRARPSS